MANIIAYIVFGSIGFVAFVYGKKNALWHPMVIGIALTVYPYFISGTLLIYAIGVCLTVVLYFWRE